MICVAICHDVEGEANKRSELFQAHAAHQFAHLGSFLLTGPIASADGSSGVGDDPRLRGSIYCLDVENLEAGRRIMETDPFMQGAWAQIDYYEWRTPRGAWLDETARPKKGLTPDFRCYYAASSAPIEVTDALMNGAVAPLASTGTAKELLGGLTLLHANSMGEARARTAGAAWVVALPIALGRWVRISSLADLQRPA